MSFQQMIWSLDHQKPLENADLSSENELENLICKDISVLNKNWLVINRQVKTAAGKFIDILCVDHDGDMVVVELKKDLTPREVQRKSSTTQPAFPICPLKISHRSI